jgi:hypothetical protein
MADDSGLAPAPRSTDARMSSISMVVLGSGMRDAKNAGGDRWSGVECAWGIRALVGGS